MQHEQVLARTEAHRARMYRFRRHLSVDEAEPTAASQTEQGGSQGVFTFTSDVHNEFFVS